MHSSDLPLQADKAQLRVFENGYRVCVGLGCYMCPHDFDAGMLIALAFARRNGIGEVEICDVHGVVERTIPVPPLPLVGEETRGPAPFLALNHASAGAFR